MDRYNAKALVNKANCELHKARLREDQGNVNAASELYNNAKELYMEGIGVEADCIEAIFNLGLCCRHMARLEYPRSIEQYGMHMRAALQAFEKLETILSDTPECIWNIASIYDELSEMEKKHSQKALQNYKRLIAQVQTEMSTRACVRACVRACMHACRLAPPHACTHV